MRSVAQRGDLFGERLREHCAGQPIRRLDVLVAGCAHDEALVLDHIEIRATGADEDHPEIRRALSERADLVAYSLGDLRSVPLPPRGFDVIQLSFLLERVRHAELVFDRLLQSLRPGGLVLLRVRDRRSAYGLLDRITPWWLRRPLWRVLVRPGTLARCPPCTSPWRRATACTSSA
ncbi:class I SAM-dependent methyltransferase [Nonomuraea antimicrobica]